MSEPKMSEPKMSEPKMSEPKPPTVQEIEALSASLKQWSSALSAVHKSLDPLRPSRLTAAAAPMTGLDPLTLGRRLEALQQELKGWGEAERAGRRGRLAADLRALCGARGLGLRVVSKEPLELRIPPLAVQIDVEADVARLLFARQPLEATEADAAAILAARDRALSALEGERWAPEAFHRDLLAAWRTVDGRGWAELGALLPELARRQEGPSPPAEAPSRPLRPYSRARFCYDLWRLRRDRCLTVDGWRLSLGPATGGSARDKRRVFWLEDADGEGQLHLSARFLAPEANDV